MTSPEDAIVACNTGPDLSQDCRRFEPFVAQCSWSFDLGLVNRRVGCWDAWIEKNVLADDLYLVCVGIYGGGQGQHLSIAQTEGRCMPWALDELILDEAFG